MSKNRPWRTSSQPPVTCLPRPDVSVHVSLFIPIVLASSSLQEPRTAHLGQAVWNFSPHLWWACCNLNTALGTQRRVSRSNESCSRVLPNWGSGLPICSGLPIWRVSGWKCAWIYHGCSLEFLQPFVLLFQAFCKKNLWQISKYIAWTVNKAYALNKA